MSLKAIVFDFDGVIANSEPLHYRGYRDTLEPEGVDLSEADYYTRYLGYDDVGAFEAIAVDHGLTWTAEKVATLVAKKATRLEELEEEGSLLCPGAAEAVARLAQAYPLAIASGALGDEIRRVLERERMASYFKAIVSAEDTPASKPAPDPYLRAVEQLSAATGRTLAPSECVAIEDSIWGLMSASAAGLRTIAVTHTYGATDLARAADDVVPHLDVLTLEYLRAFARRTSSRVS